MNQIQKNYEFVESEGQTMSLKAEVVQGKQSGKIEQLQSTVDT